MKMKQIGGNLFKKRKKAYTIKNIESTNKFAIKKMINMLKMNETIKNNDSL